MFLKLEKIKGESKDKVHKDSIHVLAWSWGLSQSGTAHSGTGAGAGKVNVQDISLTKWVDSSSTALIVAACKGTHIKEAKLTVRKAGDKPLEYIKITLTDVMVTNVTVSGTSSGDTVVVNYAFQAAKIKTEYSEQTAQGGKGATSQMGFSIKENKEA